MNLSFCLSAALKKWATFSRKIPGNSDVIAGIWLVIGLIFRLQPAMGSVAKEFGARCSRLWIATRSLRGLRTSLVSCLALQCLNFQTGEKEGKKARSEIAVAALVTLPDTVRVRDTAISVGILFLFNHERQSPVTLGFFNCSPVVAQSCDYNPVVAVFEFNFHTLPVHCLAFSLFPSPGLCLCPSHLSLSPSCILSLHSSFLLPHLIPSHLHSTPFYSSLASFIHPFSLCTSLCFWLRRWHHPLWFRLHSSLFIVTIGSRLLPLVQHPVQLCLFLC